MPIELLDLFFDELPALHDVVRLAITCKPLLAVGKRHLLRASRAHYAPWAGARLISSTLSLPALIRPYARAFPYSSIRYFFLRNCSVSTSTTGTRTCSYALVRRTDYA